MPLRSDDDGCLAFPTGSCPLPPNRGPSSVPNVRITHAFLGHRSYHLLLASSSELFSLWTLCPAACFGSPPVNDAAQRSSPNTHWGNGCRGAGGRGRSCHARTTPYGSSGIYYEWGTSVSALCQSVQAWLPCRTWTRAPPAQFPGTVDTTHYDVIMPSWVSSHKSSEPSSKGTLSLRDLLCNCKNQLALGGGKNKALATV